MPTIKVKNIQSYIDAVRDKINLHYIIKPEGDFYLLDGVLVNAKLFDKAVAPIELQRNSIDKGFRLDGRSNWID